MHEYANGSSFDVPGPEAETQSRHDIDPAGTFGACVEAISLGLGDLKSAVDVQVTEIQLLAAIWTSFWGALSGRTAKPSGIERPSR